MSVYESVFSLGVAAVYSAWEVCFIRSQLMPTMMYTQTQERKLPLLTQNLKSSGKFKDSHVFFIL